MPCTEAMHRRKKHGECIPGLHMTLNASWRPGWLRVKPTCAVQGNMGLGWYQTSSTNGKKAYRLGLSWFNWWVSFAPEFLCCYFCESSCLFYLSFNFDFYVSKIMHL